MALPFNAILKALPLMGESEKLLRSGGDLPYSLKLNTFYDALRPK